MRPVARGGLFALAILLAFAAGVRLSGVSRDKFSWCRDVDYGNLPQWLALIVGGAVAYFTIDGIWTAKKSYRDDVRTREYAQARLLHAAIDRSDPVTSAEIYLPEPAALIYSVKDHSHGLLLNETSTILKVPNGIVVQIIYFNVFNNSDEIITVLRLARFETKALQTDVTSDRRIPGAALGAKNSRQWAIVTDHEDLTSGYHDAELIFQDSAGEVWRRVGSRPVEKFKPTGPEWDLTDPKMPLWAPWRAETE